jgi:hypothetical protein
LRPSFRPQPPDAIRARQAQYRPFVEIGKTLESGRADWVDRTGEVRVNLRPGDVADDQERGVFERFAVLTELAIGFG